MQMIVHIEDDVLEGAKAIAEHQKMSLDEFVSDLIKERVDQQLPPKRNGVPLIKRHATGRVITPEFVNDLRDEDP